MSARGPILVLNAGSSSLKFALFSRVPELAVEVRGAVEDLDGIPHLAARDRDGSVLVERRLSDDPHPQTALDAILAFVADRLGGIDLAAVGHRIVHGGADFAEPAIVTPALFAQLERLLALDPLHLPLNLAPIRAIAERHPGLPQVVCFDTAFHRSMPLRAQAFALPREVTDLGVRRYGFHGLSFESVSTRLRETRPALAGKRVIVAHLGSGASLCALVNGASVATTTGFSALDGLVMATRCGSLDPGVLLHLGRLGRGFADIEEMLYRRSGLLGVSGVSGDIRKLEASTDPHAAEAIDLFVHRLVCEVGAMAASAGGFDGLVFTAGIGQHAPSIRAAACARLSWLGVRLDAAANAADEEVVSTADSSVEVLVAPTDEEAVIARHACSMIDANRRPPASMHP